MIECGLQEFFPRTSTTIYSVCPYEDEGTFYFDGLRKEINWGDKYLKILGNEGSNLFTPVMRVTFFNGTKKFIPCWEEKSPETNI